MSQSSNLQIGALVSVAQGGPQTSIRPVARLAEGAGKTDQEPEVE